MIGKELKELLLKENLKIVDLSKILGINQKTLSNYVNDVSDPDVKTLRLIKQKYKENSKDHKNINLNFLISGEGTIFLEEEKTDEELFEDFKEYMAKRGRLIK